MSAPKLAAALALYTLTACVAPQPGAQAIRPPLAQARAFLDAYMDPSGRIVDTGNAGVSHSEGQGYGLLFAEAAADRSAFDRILAWTRLNLGLRHDGLFAWRWSPETRGVDDTNNASDGDILVAWALLRAFDRWSDANDRRDAMTLLAAIRSRLILETSSGPVLLPAMTGFVHDQMIVTNLSYWIFPAFDRFEQEEPGHWRRLSDAGLRLAATARHGAHGLPTDWTAVTPDGRLLPASGQPPEFGYNAVRVPLHLCWSVRFDAAGTMLRRAILDRMLGFWSEQKPMPDRWDVERDTAAGGPAPKGFTDIAALVASSCRPTGTDAVAIPKEESYYSAALMTLVALARADLQQTGQP